MGRSSALPPLPPPLQTARAARRQNCFSLSHIHPHIPALNLFPQDRSARSSLVQPSSCHPYPTLRARGQQLCSSLLTPALPEEDEEHLELYLLLSQGSCCTFPFPLSRSKARTPWRSRARLREARTNTSAASTKVTSISTSGQKKLKNEKKLENRPKAQPRTSICRKADSTWFESLFVHSLFGT